MSRSLLILIALSIAISTSCDDGSKPDPGQTVGDAKDGKTDVSMEIVQPADTDPLGVDSGLPDSPDVVALDPCLELPFEGIVPVDLWGPDTQIHGAAAFDGAGIWVAYNRGDVDGGSGFDVFATRIGCDGAVLVEPFLVNEAVSDNETDPAIAVSGDALMIAWQSDNGQGPNNLSVWYRSYQTDGTPLMDQDKRLDFSPAGFTVDRNGWMPALAGTDSGFALVAAYAPEGYNVFQTWLQVLDPDGDPTSEGLHLFPDPDHSQVRPAVCPDGEDSFVVAWDREHIEDDTVVEVVTAGTDGLTGSPWHPMEGDSTVSPTLSKPTGQGEAWVGFQRLSGDEPRVALQSVDSLSQGGEATLPGGNDAQYSPVLTKTKDGGALAWYVSQGGLANDLIVSTFIESEGLVAWNGQPQIVNPVPAAPYPASLVALPGGYFITWSDGTSPDFRLKGRFIRTME